MNGPAATLRLRRAEDPLPARIFRSAQATDSPVTSTACFAAWLEDRRRQLRQRVKRVPFAALDGWHFAAGTGNLVHRSGRFFAVEGLRVRSDYGAVSEWTQPIVNQPEIGILGILVKEFDGVLHCLMQAKSEPGNCNDVQLSPTVQATRSNYTRVHGGQPVPYLEEFRRPEPGRVVVNVLQSEQGSWFYRKRNRNMIVETTGEVDVGENFCWLTIGQLHRLLAVDNLVNMDSRTVLSCLPMSGPVTDGPGDDWAGAVLRSSGAGYGSIQSTREILSWITDNQVGHELSTGLLPLGEVGDGWRRTDSAISHRDGLFFSVIGVHVAATGREVTTWSQPLVEPHGLGLVAFLACQVGGVVHVLVNARVEPGYLDVIELAPSVQCTPDNYAHLAAGSRPRFLDMVLAAAPDRIRFDTVLSEEGGRFYHAQSRYVVVEVDQDFARSVPGDYRWMTLHQLTGLLQHSHYVNVQARTLLACMRGL